MPKSIDKFVNKTKNYSPTLSSLDISLKDLEVHYPTFQQSIAQLVSSHAKYAHFFLLNHSDYFPLTYNLHY